MNCLESTIPASLCSLKNIEVLSLNGLGWGDSCGDVQTIPLFGTRIFSGDDVEIPSCLWSIENMKTLHLAGNGYGGEIHSDIASTAVNDLTLSHNLFEGTIPAFVQNILNVDVSHNRFNGRISDVVNVSIVKKLSSTVNRLSGRLSQGPLELASSLDILHGNMFSCDTVPENDEGAFSYICGKKQL